MGDVILFPGRLRKRRRARTCPSAEEAWAIAADHELQRFAGWAWPDGVPGDVGDGWWRFVSEWRAVTPGVAPAEAPWHNLWGAYAEGALSWRADWRAAVKRGLNINGPDDGGDAA